MAGQHWQQSSSECEQLLAYRAPVMHGTGGFDRDKNTIDKALRRDDLCIFVGMTKGTHMHMHEWTSELITQRPAISQGDPLAGWAMEDKWVLQGQLSDSLEGTKCPLQRQGTT